jgi:hypothetical protein
MYTYSFSFSGAAETGPAMKRLRPQKLAVTAENNMAVII